MIASRTLFFFFTFLLVSVSALPLHNHQRRCRHKASTQVAVALPTTTVESSSHAVSSTAAPQTEKAEKPSSTKAPSSTKTSSSTKSTKASSSAAQPESTKASESEGSSSNLRISSLFPVSKSLKSWSTSSLADDPLPLSDSTLNPHNLLSALSHSYVAAPDGKKSMKAHFPKGSYTFTHSPQGGLSFYSPGADSVDLTTAKEATFGYSVFFQEGWQWKLGGKLPGLYGGNSDKEAVGCSGGSRSSACFSARLMWREDGAGEMYTYLPPSFKANKGVCDIPPFSTCNDVYGASVGRGSFEFKAGQWNTVSQRVRLNDVGKSNGELELFAGGKSVVKVDGLVLRDSDEGRIRGIQMQTFFGGSSTEYASPISQDAYFSDFSVAITDTL